MTWGRSASADDPDAPRHGRSHTYGPDPSHTHGPDPSHTHGPGADPPPAYGGSPTYGPAGPAYGPPATTPAYGSPLHGAPSPTFGPAASSGTWPASPEPPPPYGPHDSGSGWSPAPITWAAPVATAERRAPWLAWSVLVLAVLVAAVLGICTYAALATVRLSAVDPWGTAWTWLTVGAGAALAAVGVILLGVLALVVCRPKRIAAAATVVAVVLPVAVLKIALSFGLAAAGQHVAMDGALLVEVLNAVLERVGGSAGPVRDALEWLVRLVSGLV